MAKPPRWLKLSNPRIEDNHVTYDAEIAWWYILYLKVINVPRALWYTLKHMSK